MTARPSRAAVESAARVREIDAAAQPEGLEGWQLAAWYAERLGEMSWHAKALAAEIERLAGAG